MDTLLYLCFYSIVGMIAFAVFKIAISDDPQKPSEPNSKNDDDDDFIFLWWTMMTIFNSKRL